MILLNQGGLPAHYIPGQYGLDLDIEGSPSLVSSAKPSQVIGLREIAKAIPFLSVSLSLYLEDSRTFKERKNWLLRRLEGQVVVILFFNILGPSSG